MITYRLADSLPKELLHKIELSTMPGAPQATAGNNHKLQEIKRRKFIEESLDKGLGSCILQSEKASEIIVKNWKHFDNERYDIIAYVVMPNHVHILIKVYENISLSKIVWSWKSYTARRIFEIPELKEAYIKSYSGLNKLELNSRAPNDRLKYINPAVACGAPRLNLWQREFWDRFIRDEKHFKKAVEYIHMNPVTAGLVSKPEKWKFSSMKEFKDSTLN